LILDSDDPSVLPAEMKIQHLSLSTCKLVSGSDEIPCS